MEVTNVSDKISHAVIGGGKVESFGMSEDAELYHILSNALYSRKKEACVREVLCNAWDSHVDSDITDTAIQITLNSEKMTIRDFGAGLPPEMIKPVYGTYGKSTKQHDGKQTGGFGLGSKAPFAYVDHFEVISCHAGTKTIYKMSQSNAEIGGKPSILPIVSVPTTESGLQVTVNLKDKDDRYEFENLIRRLVQMGDMNATLNGIKLDTIPFSTAENNFVMVEKSEFNINHVATRDFIYIRYGHVIYPLEVDDRYSVAFERILEFLTNISKQQGRNGYGYHNDDKNWVLILQAEPHTISVTPSRESLSMTDKTVATVMELLNNFIKISLGKVETICLDMNKELISMAPLVSSPKDIFKTEKKLPLIDRVVIDDRSYITNFVDLTRRYMKRTYPLFTNFHKSDMLTRLDAMINLGIGNRGLIQSYRAELQKGGFGLYSNWFHRKLVSLVLRGHDPKKNIDPARLYAYKIVKRGKYQSSLERGFQLATAVDIHDLEGAFPYLRNVVILAPSRNMAMMDRLPHFPIFKHWLGDALNSLWYAVPRNAEKIKKAKDFFEAKGFTVIDLTISHPWEAIDIAEPEKRDVSRPKLKGIPCLSAGKTATGNFSSQMLFIEGAKRIEKPEFVIRISSNSDNRDRFPDTYRLTSAESAAIVRLYGDKVGIVQNTPQERKYRDQGAKEMNAWLAEKLLEEYTKNSKIKQHYVSTLSHRTEWRHHDDVQRIHNICKRDQSLRKHFGLYAPTEQNERDIITVFESFNTWQRKEFPQLEKIDKLITKWVLCPASLKVAETLKNSHLCKLLDSRDLDHMIQNVSNLYTVTQIEAARKFLLAAMEG